MQTTYAEYLENWANHFGDDLTGNYSSWHYGKERKNQVRKLSQAEFNEHMKALDSAMEKYNAGLKAGNKQQIEQALIESLPHEVALLL